MVHKRCAWKGGHGLTPLTVNAQVSGDNIRPATDDSNARVGVHTEKQVAEAFPGKTFSEVCTMRVPGLFLSRRDTFVHAAHPRNTAVLHLYPGDTSAVDPKGVEYVLCSRAVGFADHSNLHKDHALATLGCGGH